MIEFVEQQALALFGRLELGDVEQHADDLCRLLAPRLADDLAAVHHPAHLAIGSPDAVFELVAPFRAGDDLLLAQPRPVAVVGMDESQARFEGRYLVAIVSAQNLPDLRRALRAVVGDVVLVSPELRGLRRRPQLFLALPERRGAPLDVVAGSSQSGIDGVGFAETRIIDHERLAAAERPPPRWRRPADA
jgi:hypothetical protein